MKTCAHCDGDLLRHGKAMDYKGDKSLVRIRYRCRDCQRTFTVRMARENEHMGLAFFSATGRPTVKDWRMAA